MNTRIIATWVACAFVCNGLRAQHVLSGLDGSAYETGYAALGEGNGSTPEHHTGAASGPDLHLWLDGHDDSRGVDGDHDGARYDWGNGPKPHGPSNGHLLDHQALGKLHDFEDEERDHHGVPTPGPDQFGLPADCSPIPEPPTEAILLAATVLCFAVRHRRCCVNLKV